MRRAGVGTTPTRASHVEPGTASTPDEAHNQPCVLIKVKDNGKGIPPDVLPHIFEPFYTTKPVGEGTGLGLSQVYGIIKQHDGYIDAQSTPDQGTTFLAYFPVATAALCVVAAGATTAARITLSP